MSVPAYAMTTDAGTLLDGCVDAEAAFRARWSCQPADDESPPSLSALPEQLDALRLVQQPAGSRVTQSKKKGSSAQEKVSGGVRRGFFDQPPHGGRKTSTAATQPPSSSLECTVVTWRTPAVPESLKLPADNPVVRQAALLDALQPGQDMMRSILDNAELLKAFDDSDVMAAVAEVAENPAAFARHAHKPRVQAFYKMMSSVAGEQLQRSGISPAAEAPSTLKSTLKAHVAQPRIIELS